MRPRGLSPAQQAFALHAYFPDAKGTLKRGRFVWTGMLQPSPLSRSYCVQVDYEPPRPPRVRVLDRLETRPGEALPHTYNTGTLCLHDPDEWTASMYIAHTIVPWTAEWLINYEIWLATGDWHGGGEWPPRRGVPEKRPDANERSAAA
jgi:hypothetical protein